jgi:hypothetical protein
MEVVALEEWPTYLFKSPLAELYVYGRSNLATVLGGSF